MSPFDNNHRGEVDHGEFLFAQAKVNYARMIVNGRQDFAVIQL